MRSDVLVLDLHSVLDFHALEDFGRVRAARNGRAAAEGLKDGLVDLAGLLIDLDLQLHDVTTSGRAHEAGANIFVFFVE